MKKWIVLPPPSKDFLSSHPELPTIVSTLLWNRHLRDQKQIDEFLNPDYETDIHDPFLFSQMGKAVKIILDAIAQNRNIVVHGDYDADGVSAATILINTLKKIGAKNVSVFIPHREIDGYGLNENTVEYFKEQKIDLIITCDCGVSNFKEIELVKKYGMQVIITDHHVVPANIPPADAIIHHLMPGEPYPDKGLCGAAVAFKLVQGLLKEHKKSNELLPDGQTHEAYEKWMLDLVAIASIGDMVPLIGESRTLTRYGLTVINKTKNFGLKKLFKYAGLLDDNDKLKNASGLSSENISYQIVPRLNAAGRMDHANSAFALLSTNDESEADTLAAQLNKNNVDRQKLTEKIVNEALAQIKEEHQENKNILLVAKENWPTGILGLVSGKIREQFYKPALVMGIAPDEITGSGRSIPEFNLIKALQDNADLFEKFGGHPQACGFTLKNKDILNEFKERFFKYTEEKLKGLELTPQITIDAEVDLDEVDWKLYDLLQKFEPFGVGNEEPKYLARNLTVSSVVPVGNDGKHLRLMVKHNSHLIKKTIGFGLGDCNKHPLNWKECLKPGDKIDLVFRISVNQWNGNRELQLTIEDIRKSQ
ncbi:MAG TPA: single-stranded-DNA-specific exonuclease RecJ [Candidatus Magasanikbacteria bacterium]|nr:single-stranded-DNA-specific exonuclease RecJ [Candidatus Magasanikbacteria bacterium]